MISKHLLSLTHKISCKQITNVGGSFRSLRTVHRPIASADFGARDFKFGQHRRHRLTCPCINSQQKCAYHLSCRQLKLEDWKRLQQYFFGALFPDMSEEKIEKFKNSSEDFYRKNCVEAPLNKRKRLLSYENEANQATEKEAGLIFEGFKKKNQILPESDENVKNLNQYLQTLRKYNNINREFEIFVFDKDKENSFDAYSYANGMIFIGKQYIDHFQGNKDWLALTIAHEMSHTLMSHQAEEWSNNLFLRDFVWHLAAGLSRVHKDDEKVVKMIEEVCQDWKSRILPHENTHELEADLNGTGLAFFAKFRYGEVYKMLDKIGEKYLFEDSEARKLRRLSEKYTPDIKKEKRKAEREKTLFKDLPDLVGEKIDECAYWENKHPDIKTRKEHLMKHQRQILGSGHGKPSKPKQGCPVC